ncbi:N-6 DNA methylase [Nannocystis pusilla]|uniref:site-specific DNA-methyltransferase (adenine-specific) n=1 Tax=Nannocystis pusilla TaxID=889268 RepID=A0ABS7TZR3_9BACT|nr:N-6 DNA methylase [Nannocystis pusilla]MBZ5713768.1 N-6 DNA methylase [Nannocystis pusilla]
MSPPSKRAILQALTVKRLGGLCDVLELDRAGVVRKDDLVDLLHRSRTASPEVILEKLSRDELKAVCRAGGLDHGGTARQPLVDRILGRAPVQVPLLGEPPRDLPSPSASPRNSTGANPPPAAPPAQPLLELGALESHLWEAANILRGSPVDRTDWKSYILPLLFFKRICDVWDEEHAAMLAEYGEDFADEHRFQVPGGCHWRDVRKAPKNIGAALANAMRGVEAANQKHLYGVFGDAQWTNKDRLPDELLKTLIEHFSALPLGNNNVASDVLGDAYEYLIKKFADSTNKKAGEFYTPRSVVRLMVDILDPREGETVYDPACGTGGMLLAAVAHVQEAGGDPRTFFGKLHGQEKNLTTAAVARMNLFLHGIEDFAVERGDTLRSPVFTDPGTGGLATFDVVLANPPFSLEQWGREQWEMDRWGRNFAGVPSDSNGDMAWVQHMVKSMAARTGRMAVVLPQGALFRGGVEAQIRQHLLQDDRIEAVIGLAPNLFYGTGLAACILVLHQAKPARRKGKVLIVDASTLFRKGRAQNFLEPEHGRQILEWFQRFEDVEDRARAVSLAEIEKEGWTLNISRYVLPPIGADIPPLPEAVAAFKAALAKCREAEDNLRRVMHEGGWLQ